MTEKPKAKPLAVHGSDAAPIVYLDGIVSWGSLNGVIQIETAANTMVPAEPGSTATVKTRVLITSHLRCSFTAAKELRDALDAALKASIPEKKAQN